MGIGLKQIGGLERKLLAYFLLIAVAALMIGIEFVIEMNSLDLKQELWEKMRDSVEDGDFTPDSPAFDPINKLRNKIIIMFGVLMFVVAIVLIMFIRNITTPLQHMANVARKINEGDLSQVVKVEQSDEIGDLGSAINELTSNLQEVAAYIGMMSEEMKLKTGDINAKVDSMLHKKETKADKKRIEEILDEIRGLEKDIASLKDISESFNFLETDIEK